MGEKLLLFLCREVIIKQPQNILPPQTLKADSSWFIPPVINFELQEFIISDHIPHQDTPQWQPNPELPCQLEYPGAWMVAVVFSGPSGYCLHFLVERDYHPSSHISEQHNNWLLFSASALELMLKISLHVKAKQPPWRFWIQRSGAPPVPPLSLPHTPALSPECLFPISHHISLSFLPLGGPHGGRAHMHALCHICNTQLLSWPHA